MYYASVCTVIDARKALLSGLPIPPLDERYWYPGGLEPDQIRQYVQGLDGGEGSSSSGISDQTVLQEKAFQLQQNMQGIGKGARVSLSPRFQSYLATLEPPPRPPPLLGL